MRSPRFRGVTHSFTCIARNGEGPALLDRMGTISREAVMFTTHLSACVAGGTTCTSDLLGRGEARQWECEASTYFCALAC